MRCTATSDSSACSGNTREGPVVVLTVGALAFNNARLGVTGKGQGETQNRSLVVHP